MKNKYHLKTGILKSSIYIFASLFSTIGLADSQVTNALNTDHPENNSLGLYQTNQLQLAFI